jgi:hypothetical protein
MRPRRRKKRRSSSHEPPREEALFALALEKRDPVFDEIVKLGRTYRKAQRPTPGSKRA